MYRKSRRKNKGKRQERFLIPGREKSIYEIVLRNIPAITFLHFPQFYATMSVSMSVLFSFLLLKHLLSWTQAFHKGFPRETKDPPSFHLLSRHDFQHTVYTRSPVVYLYSSGKCCTGDDSRSCKRAFTRVTYDVPQVTTLRVYVYWPVLNHKGRKERERDESDARARHSVYSALRRSSFNDSGALTPNEY